MAPAVQALRGATTVEEDSEKQITERVQELVGEMMARNDIAHDDIISIIFTATEDLVAIFPAAAARGAGLGDVPMLCARELSVDGGTLKCLRVLMHVNTGRSRQELRHVYLHGAQGLRDDLPG
ncbi:MAG TPA: chorismate mutase [Acidimicrobiales bacterium]|nr:chorismate mutase [Acidimicrobiales bacterium]